VCNSSPNILNKINEKTGTTEGNVRLKGLLVDRSNNDTVIVENNQLLFAKSELLKYDGLIAAVKTKILIDCGASE